MLFKICHSKRYSFKAHNTYLHFQGALSTTENEHDNCIEKNNENSTMKNHNCTQYAFFLITHFCIQDSPFENPWCIGTVAVTTTVLFW